MSTVRAALPSDIPHLIRFQQMMAMETEQLVLNATILTRGIQALFDDPAKGKYYVAEVDGLIAGCLMTTYEWSDWRCGNILWIQSVYIDRAHRGKGLYKKMYEHIQSLVTQAGSEYRGIRLYVDKNNRAAQQVYEKLGMNGEHYQVYEWLPK
jgi:ribosomal protein S18 acetylase RimI-like enzyme